MKILKVEKVGGRLVAMDVDGIAAPNGTVRDHMLQLAFDNDQCIVYNTETGKCYRKDIGLFNDQLPTEKEVEASEKIDADPVLAFIHKSPELIPDTMKISDLKWKYLMRSAVRSKNIMMTGPAGCGKTMAAK